MPSLLDAARLTRADAVLAALAVLGWVAFVWWLPQVHPDTAVDFGLTESGAEARAVDIVEAAGFETDGLERFAVLRPRAALLDSLQRALGRREMTRALRAEPGRLPAFAWRVQFVSDRRAAGPMGQPKFDVRLGQDGRLWALSNAENVLPSEPGDRADLLVRVRERLGGEPPRIPEDRVQDPITFRIGEGPVAVGAGWEDALRREVGALVRPGSQSIGPATAAAVALDHVRRTALADVDLQPVLVERVAGRGAYAARVWLSAQKPVWGQRVEAAVDVTAGGDLLALASYFDGVALREAQPGAPTEGNDERRPAEEAAGSDGGTTMSVSGDLSEISPFSVLAAVLWVALALSFAVVFVRRLTAQALDLRAALTDAAAVALAVTLYPVLLLPMMREMYGLDGYQLVAATVAGTLFWIAAAGVMTLIASAVSDSLMRARRREKLDALALLRQGRVLNRPVGAALFRGALAAVALLGLAVTLWALLPIRADYADSGWGVYQLALSPGAIVFTQAFWFQLAIGLVVFVGVGARLMGAGRRWVPAEGAGRAAVVVGGLAVCAGLLRIGPGDLFSDPGWSAFLYGAVYGAALGLVLWHFDALATLVAFILAEAAWHLTPMLWAEGSPLVADAVGLLALLPVVGLLGTVGMRRAPQRAELRRYVPSYITELAHRERLQREVEIAREVQRSFLPATMPDVQGLDLAAVCLPAEEVGGDYYDAFLIPSPGGAPPRLGVVVGDVSGKGIQAAFYMTLVKGIVRTLAPSGLGPAAVLTRLNEVFAENAQPGAFVSAIYGVIDPAARTFTYARAGHNPLLVRRRANGQADGRPVDVEARRPPGIAVGLTAGPAFGQALCEDTVLLAPGDTLVLYTDGFSEAMDGARALYTDERLARLFADAPRAAAANAAALVGHAVADVRAFASADANPDDMTMLIVHLIG